MHTKSFRSRAAGWEWIPAFIGTSLLSKDSAATGPNSAPLVAQWYSINRCLYVSILILGFSASFFSFFPFVLFSNTGIIVYSILPSQSILFLDTKQHVALRVAIKQGSVGKWFEVFFILHCVWVWIMHLKNACWYFYFLLWCKQILFQRFLNLNQTFKNEDYMRLQPIR